MSGVLKYLYVSVSSVLLWIGLICSFAIISFSASANKTHDLFITAEISNKTPYQGEAVMLTYKLCSRNADIKYANRVSETQLGGGEASFSSAVQTGSRGRKETINGEQFYVFPLENYVVTFDKKGNYTYKGGSFEIGVNYPVVYEDPFWGRRRGYKTQDYTLDVPQVNFKVRQRPNAPSDSDNITAVGDFSVSCFIPPGDIIIDNSATAIITVKGTGILDEETLPDYSDAFSGKGIRLKSMSENRNRYFDGKNVVSELSLECEFVPSAKEVEIGEISFRFFNPSTGKYEEKRSLPVKIVVRSIASKSPTTDI